MRLFFLFLLMGCASCSYPKLEFESSIVLLTTIDGQGGGTGFYVRAASGKPYILTNRHICEGAAIYQYKAGRQIELSIKEIAPDTDLCLLEPLRNNAEPFELSKREPAQHEKLHIIGWGLLLGESRTDGYWVGYLPGQLLGVVDPGYATVPVLPGNSGSPVLNEKNEVVAVLFASSGQIDNRSLCVPLEQVRQFLSVY